VIHFDVPGVKAQLKNLEGEQARPDFWEDTQNAQNVQKQIKALKLKLESYEKVRAMGEDLEVVTELYEADPSEDNENELTADFGTLKNTFEKFMLSTLLTGQYDANNVILSIHPGAGGTESQDWAEMLLRMYTRYAERAGYKTTTLDYLDGDVAGIKSVTLLMEGVNAYGYLKGEKGVHRLVRISPFDSAGRRHTSFASVDIMPEITESIDVEIDPKDLKIDTYRSSGAGGQHVNKTDSAVRITHIPTGIVVACQNERSQHQNKEVAMKMLTSKLTELLEKEHKEKISDLQGDYGQIAWGNQIRSYVFHPYSLVKDHRTNAETGNIQAVMDGALDLFIDAYLKDNIAQ
jgi:peptide chain release factor 2